MRRVSTLTIGLLLLCACGSRPAAGPTIPADQVQVATIPPASTIEPTTAPIPEPTIAPAGPTDPPTPALPPPIPDLPAPSFNNCQEDPNAGQAANYPVLIAKVEKASEIVRLQNVSPDPVNLDGWKMCSVKGNQQVPIGGPLAPGETREFPSTDAPIWSNSDPDPGALYNDQGQLVSYWPDH